MTTEDPTSYRRVLALETATPVQALALLDGDLCLEHRVLKVRYNHGSSLLYNVDQVLKSQGLTVHDIDLFAAGLGPGSFTGLRVGLATAKALARASEAPIVGVSSLAALAYQPACLHPGRAVFAAFDARRREVFGGAYRFDKDTGLVEVLAEAALSPEDFADVLRQAACGSDQPPLLIGDGVSAYAELRALAAEELVHHIPRALAAPSALATAILGREKALRQGPDDLVSLEPNYLRPSDAKLPNITPHPDFQPDDD